MSAGNPQVLVRAAALRVAAGRRRCGIRVCEGWLTPGLDPGPLWAQRALGTPGVGALGAPLQAHGPDKGTIKTVLPRRRVPPSPVLGSRGLGPIPVASVGVRSPAHVRQGARVRRPTARLSPWGPLVLTPLRGASPLGGPGRHAGPPSPGAHLHTIPRGVCPDVSLGPESGVGPVEGTLTDEIAPGGAGPGTSRHHGRGPWSAGTRAGVRRVFSQKRVPVNVLNVLRRRHRGAGSALGAVSRACTRTAWVPVGQRRSHTCYREPVGCTPRAPGPAFSSLWQRLEPCETRGPTRFQTGHRGLC